MNVAVNKKIAKEYYIDFFSLLQMRLFATDVVVVEIPPTLVLEL